MSQDVNPIEDNQVPSKSVETPLPLRGDQIPIVPGADNRPSTTTLQQDIGADSRRAVNLIWERNQERLSMISLVIANLVCSVVVVNGILPNATQGQIGLANTAITFLITNSMIIMQYYFNRTNHQKIGGVGSTEAERREGRAGNV